MSRFRTLLAAAIALVALSDTARADVQPTETTEEVAFASNAPGAVPVAPPSDTPVAAPTEIDEEATGSARFVEGDARSGQGFATPTAFTAPKGSGSMDAWFPLLPVGGVFTASYAVTSRIEIGAGTMMAFEDGDAVGGVFTAKVQALRTRRAALSLKVHHFRIPDEEDSLTTFTAVGSTCLGADCRVVASAHLTAVPTEMAVPDGNSSDVLVVVAGGSIVAGGKVKAVAEGITFEDGDQQIVVVFGGIRLARPRWAADIGFAAGSDGGDFELLPVPLGGISARF